jgi:D-alanine-D-alanine ligase
LYNLKRHRSVGPDAPADALAEYDSEETVRTIQSALTTRGHQVVGMEADEGLMDALRRERPDICFNIAEGLRGDARESHVPALLEVLGIPYTGSKVLAHAISLDKAIAKRVWRDVGLPTAPFQVFRHGDEPLSRDLSFPLFVKPVREGSGMGIDGRSFVQDEASLRQRVRWVTQTYHQPALVEQHLAGREFTVGLIGNAWGTQERRSAGLYNERGYHLFPILEIDARVGVGEGSYNTAAKSLWPGEEGAPLYTCPADMPAALEGDLKGLAVEAFESIGALDVGRVDFRLGPDGRPHILEINTLPGMKPGLSDLCLMADADGLPYEDLVNEILSLSVNRYAQEGRSIGA